MKQSMFSSILALLLMVHPFAAENHIFTDAQGRKLDGQILSVVEDSVKIRRADGKIFTVSLETLSVEDQKFIRDEVEKSKPTEVKGLWSKSVFTVNTIASASEPIARWIVFNSKSGDFEVGPADAKAVIEHFNKQIASRKKHGIFIRSVSYAVPDTSKERGFLTAYQRTTWKNPEWLSAEAALIGELKKECETAGIALYVNTSFDREEPWKILVPPKD